MTQPTYTWRSHPGFTPPKGLTADAAAAELERIRLGHDGRLLPRDIVEVSRNKRAPLHACFEWDDATAGNAYREQQARHLVRVVRVVVEGDGDLPYAVHISANKSAPAYYQRATEAVGNADEWTAAVSELAQKLASAKTALDDLARIAGEKGDDASVALVAISKAFVTIDKAIEGLRH